MTRLFAIGFGGGISQGIAGLRRPILQDDEPGQEGTGGGGTATATPPSGSAPQQQAAAPAGLTAENIQQITGPLLDRVNQSVETAIAPIREENTRLREQIDQLSQPVRQAGFLMGGAPGVRTGEDPLTSRGYQMFRVMAYRQGQMTDENCKVEIDIHNRLREIYVQQGAMPVESQNSVLVPMCSDHIQGMDSEMGIEVRQMIRQGVGGFDPLELGYILQRAGIQSPIMQALSQYDETGLGNLLGPTQRGEMIELLRNREVFARAGATELALPSNGRLQFDKQTGATTAEWLNEVPGNQTSPTMTNSAPTTGFLTLMAKKLGVFVRLPNELLRFANPTVETFIRNDMARVMALAVDLSMLEGAATGNRIKGLINYSGITTRIASTVATDGDTLEPRDLGRMISDAEQNNHDIESNGWSWVMRPELCEQILERRASVYDGSSTSELGQYLFATNREDIATGKPMRLRGYPTVRSTQVSKARTKGSGTDLSYLLGGIFRHWIIGRIGVMEFATTDKSDTAFQTDSTHTRVIQHVDAGPRYEDAFVMVDDLLRELP